MVVQVFGHPVTGPPRKETTVILPTGYVADRMLTACALSPTDAALMRTAVAPGAVCVPSPYRGSGIFGRSRPFLVSYAPPALPQGSARFLLMMGVLFCCGAGFFIRRRMYPPPLIEEPAFNVSYTRQPPNPTPGQPSPLPLSLLLSVYMFSVSMFSATEYAGRKNSGHVYSFKF
ncbi:hypothetical protein EI555_005365 [Monodon monoceros]|uniref:WW domain binding protein VOPP1 n=1 Tax=Monodon monoceros TaxID=40151 RepID=A0A4U1EC29_MONMO|nr:hypothetical protein EI555_005365 [Monodon monoceros]